MENAIAEKHSDAPIRDFLGWFQREFLKRRKRNDRYSVRAFSNYLDLAPATVSQFLAGKRKPSVKFASKLLEQLEATPQEKNLVLASLQKNKKSEGAGSEKTPQKDFELIALDSFKLLADWYHYAILELTTVKGFKTEYSWIANQLNISVTEARQAVERLLRLDLLEEKDGAIFRTQSFYTNYDEGMTNSALKQLQRHVLQKALEAIDVIPQSQKDITSMTMAIDETKIPEAKDRIKSFRRELCAFLESGNQTRVFNLGIQLYPVSKGPKK